MRSTMLALRSLLMIACTIAVPVLAIFGTDWLTQMLGLTEKPNHNWRSSPRLAKAEGPSRYLDPSARGQPASAAPARMGQPAPPASSNFGPPSAPRWQTGSQPQPGVGVRASFEAPANPVVASAPPPVRVQAMPAENSPRRPVGVGSAPPAGSDWFGWTQQRLRALGATYYLLETWGRQGEMYRFHCKMAIAGNPDYTKHFESTGSDAAGAMQDVLRQVEAWRAGRDP